MQAHIRELETKVVKLKTEIELRKKVVQVIIVYSPFYIFFIITFKHKVVHEKINVLKPYKIFTIILLN